jgi:hypothetical protein
MTYKKAPRLIEAGGYTLEVLIQELRLFHLP